MLRHLRNFSGVILLMISATASARMLSDLTPRTLHDVLKVARAIYVVQPYLSETKYLQYALEIYRSAKRYRVEPSVLISITQQESGFRENLPEGAAGERGICQILKNWLENPRFRREFPSANLRDFDRSDRSFMFAGWILAQLKRDTTSQMLPYWSFYNSVGFKNRQRYYSLVNRYVLQIKKYRNYILMNEQPEEGFSPVAVEESPRLQMVAAVATSAGYWKPAHAEEESEPYMIEEEASETLLPKAPVHQPTSSSLQIASRAPQNRLIASVAKFAPEISEGLVVQESKPQPEALPVNGSWIPDAFRKLHEQTIAKQTTDNPLKHTESAVVSSPSIVRAAAELDIPSVFFDSAH